MTREKLIQIIISKLPHRWRSYIINDIKVDDLPGEEWRTIEGYPLYQVSNLGRVKMVENEYFNTLSGYLLHKREHLLIAKEIKR